MASGSGIDKRAIARMMSDIQHEFDKHPIRVPIATDAPDVPSGGGGNVTYNGPVIHGDVNGAQLAWGNQSVTQSSTTSEQQVAPGFEAIAAVVIKILEGLPALSPTLPAEEVSDAQDAAREILQEVTAEQPDRGKLRRTISALKGYLAPLVMGLPTAAGDGIEEWARHAIEQLGTPF